jgi:beta-glucanase (GH16 family)
MRPSRAGEAIRIIPSPGSLLWSDDFVGTAGAAPSATNWGYHVGRYGAGSGENQYYTTGNANAALDGSSNLVITARQETTPDSASSPNNYTSARVVSLNLQTFSPPCRVSVRAKVPVTKGLLPAIWTMGQDPTHYEEWPRNGEIDIMEVPAFYAAGADGYRLSMNLHGPASGSPTTHKNIGGQYMNAGASLGDDYHVYGIDWYTDRVIWHLDGRIRMTITSSDWAAISGDWTPFSGSIPHYLLLNIAVGNDWTGDPGVGSTFPISMLVDWVKVWSLA